MRNIRREFLLSTSARELAYSALYFSANSSVAEADYSAVTGIHGSGEDEVLQEELLSETERHLLVHSDKNRLRLLDAIASSRKGHGTAVELRDILNDYGIDLRDDD